MVLLKNLIIYVSVCVYVSQADKACSRLIIEVWLNEYNNEKLVCSPKWSAKPMRATRRAA